MAVDREALRAWLEASCAAQGVSVLVSDPGTVAQVGVLLGGRGPARRLPAGSAAPDSTVTAARWE
jgi:hypothetical protein